MERHAHLSQTPQDLTDPIPKAGWASQALCGALALAILCRGAHRSGSRAGVLNELLPRLVRRSPFADRLRMARRDALPTNVVQVLAEDLDDAVTVALLHNAGVVLPTPAIDVLVARARLAPALRSALADRSELTRAQGARMASFSAICIRRRLARRFGPHVLSVFAADCDDNEDWSGWVSKLHARRELTAATLLAILRKGRDIAFRAGLARLCGACVELEPRRSSDGVELAELDVDKAARSAFSIAAVALSAVRERPR